MASKLRSALIAIPLAALLALSGCAEESSPVQSNPAPSASETTFASTIPADELGLVLPGDAAKDDAGSYRNAVLNGELAASKYSTLADLPNAAELEAAGYSDEDLIAAQEATYRTLVELNLDGPLLESDSTTTLEWFEAGGDEFFGPDSQEIVRGSLTAKPTTSLFVQNDFAAPLLRDGDLRIKGVDISTEAIVLYEFEGKTYLTVQFKASALYRSSTEGILATVQSVKGADFTQADLEALNPAMAEAESSYRVQANGEITYGKLDFTRFEGLSFYYSWGITDSANGFLALGNNDAASGGQAE